MCLKTKIKKIVKTYFSGKSYLINFKFPCKIPHYFYLLSMEMRFYRSCFVKYNLVEFPYSYTRVNGFYQIILATMYRFVDQYTFKNNKKFKNELLSTQNGSKTTY